MHFVKQLYLPDVGRVPMILSRGLKPLAARMINLLAAFSLGVSTLTAGSVSLPAPSRVGEGASIVQSLFSMIRAESEASEISRESGKSIVFKPATFAHPSPRVESRASLTESTQPNLQTQFQYEFELIHDLGPFSASSNFSGAGDLNADGKGDIAVGDYQADPGGILDAGRLSVLSGIDGSLMFVVDGQTPSGQFGSSHSGVGDVDGDNVPDIIVSAPGEDPGGLSDAGSVYLVSGADQSFVLQINGTSQYDALGGHLAPTADYDLNGRKDFLATAGASGSDPTVHLYSTTTGTVIYTLATLTSNSPTIHRSTSGGDANGDLVPDHAVYTKDILFDNGYNYDSGQVFSGADGSLLFYTGWIAQYSPISSNAILGGDANSDGNADLWFGASAADCGGVQVNGYIRVYSVSSGSLILEICGDATHDRFGYSMARLGDLTGDGEPEMAVGASGTDHSGLSGTGSVYLLDGRTAEVLGKVNGSAASSSLGRTVENIGDIDGDGSDDLGVEYLDEFGSPRIAIYSISPSAAVSENAVLVSIDECMAEPATQGYEGGPINTRTGAYDYSVEDLSIQTSAGPLVFRRTYSSAGTGLYSGALGVGWTHNHAGRLIFPADPGGKLGFVLFQGGSGNRFQFVDNGDGTYSPSKGVCGELVRDDGPPVIYTMTDNAQNRYVFDVSGVLLSRSDPTGHSWAYSYGPEGLLEQITDDTGSRWLFFNYDEQYRLETVDDHTGRLTSYSFDANGDLTSYTDVLGQQWIYVYDADHHLTEVRDPRGILVERTEFDLSGRAIRQYDGENSLVVALTYNPDGTTTITDGLGNSHTDIYDNRRTNTEEVDALGNSSATVYDYNFRPAQLIDEIGNSASLTWSNDGSTLNQVIDALGNQTNLDYDSLNNLTSVVDPRGYLTTYQYSGTLLISTTNALNQTTSYTYTDALDAPAPEGLLESVMDPLGNTTTYAYDQFGQRISMTDGLGTAWTYSYDAMGNLIETVDPKGRVTRNEYDSGGRLVRTTRNYDLTRPQNDEGQYNIITQSAFDEVGNQTQVIDTFGRITLNEYDDAGRLVKTTQNYDPARPLNDQNEYNLVTSFAYDVNGNLMTVTDPLGRTITHSYDQLDRLVSTTDPLGNSSTTSYNPDGTVASDTDARGNTTSYTYDDLKRVISTTDALGNASSTTYDQAGNVAATTDANGNTTTYTYDALNRLIKVTDPLLGVTEHFYDAAGNRVQTIDPNGNATTYSYDPLNRLQSVTDARGHVTTYAFDVVGNRVSVTDARNNTTTFTYDLLDRQVSVTDPLLNVSSREYDALGNVTARVDANSNRTTFTYDLLNRLVSETNALGGVTSFSYDAVGNQTAATDARGNITTTAYDALNRPTTNTDANGNSTTTAYDAAGNVISVTDPLGNAVTFSYDAANHQITATNPLGTTTSFNYDANGNRVSLTDAASVVTQYEYDSLNRLTAVVENLDPSMPADAQTNVRSEYTYDGVGNRLTIKDGNGNTTTFTYSATNQLATEEDALLNTISYGYDQAGNQATLTDALGNVTIFSYDANNRLAGIDYPTPDADVTFAYDAAGNRTSMTDGVGTTTWTYDALHRVTSVTDPFTQTVSYGYDASGNRTSLTYPDARSVSYTYDPANRMAQVTDWSTGVTSYTYDAASRLTNAALPNGVNSAYGYNAAGWPTSIAHTVGLETLSSFQYSYDAVGNRVSAVEELARPSGVASLSNGSIASARVDEPDALAIPAGPITSGAGWFPVSISELNPSSIALARSSELTATPSASESTVSASPTVDSATAPAEPTSTPQEEATPAQTPTLVATSVPTKGEWVVDSVADGADVAPGDGECADVTGACTLRAAIEEANATRGRNFVSFNIPGDGLQTIRPLSPLPAITEPLSIDGNTQPGYEGIPLVAVDGSDAGDWVDGLQITGGASTVRGLALFGFGRAAISLSGGPGNVIESSLLGPHPSADQVQKNHIGVLINNSSNNRIGGNEGAGNVVSGSTIGVYVVGNRANGTSIVGNRFGLDVDGQPSATNAIDIRVREASGSSIAGRAGETRNEFSRVFPTIYLEGIAPDDIFTQSDLLEPPYIRELDPEPIPLEDLHNQGKGGSGLAKLRDWLSSVIESIRREAQKLRLAPVMGFGLEEVENSTASGLIFFPGAPHQAIAGARSSLSSAQSTSGFTVDTTDDRRDKRPGDGLCETTRRECSLRAAIEEVNANSTLIDPVISFGISGTGPHSIQPGSPLPAIVRSVRIDATTQTGYQGTPLIELDGSNAGVGSNGLTVSANSTVVRGFAINRFDGFGVELNAGGNSIEANHIGLNPEGTQSLGNLAGGILIIGSSDNIIGGTVAASRNMVSGNQGNGVLITGLEATGNTVEGNFIGTDVGGLLALGNSQSGVRIDDAPNNIVGGTTAGTGNIISGNQEHGVHIVGSNATGNQLLRNTVGLDAAGAALGNGQGGSGHGIQINASGNLIGGTTASSRNVISGNADNGVYIVGDTGTGDVTNNVVQGNYIGTDASGNAPIGNGFRGVVIREADNNTVGGASSGAGNVVSGNSSNGVFIWGQSATKNAVQGNLVGTNADGTAAVGNGGDGVVLYDAPSNTIGGDVANAGNIISGNGGHGIYLTGFIILGELSGADFVVSARQATRNYLVPLGASANKIQGNLIGTDMSGTVDLGNVGTGVVIGDGVGNTIGGTTAAARNVISGNDGGGVRIFSFDETYNNVVIGNFIGTDSSGTTALGNAGNGVEIGNSANNRIGGTAAGEGNVIAANGSDGIRIRLNGSTGNIVQGNFIGTDMAGTFNLGNAGAGISITASDNTIGGSAFDAGNVVANNQQDGVYIDFASSSGYAVTGNGILGNSIFDNSGLGIDLDPDGVTANDLGDPDSGANDLQNFPVLTSASTDGSTTLVDGTLNSSANTTYRIEFFANPSCDVSGNGEGKTYLGSTDVVTDVNGDATISASLPAGVNAGDAIVGTATDPSGSTSEFSSCVTVAGGAPITYNWHYEYDPLYRLTYACSDWDEVAFTCREGAEFFSYTYDAVGNRLTHDTLVGTNAYTYDVANRLTSVDGVAYTWDAKGNLLSDGDSEYSYDQANRLVGVTQGSDTYSFAYNGLGDRLQQTVNGVVTIYTLDLNRGLTQVLSDDSNTYAYGVSRVGEERTGGWYYHLADSLGSVRQLANPEGTVALTNSFEPFGSIVSSEGMTRSNYEFTGEWADPTGLIFLRKRYYAPTNGSFSSRDSWQGQAIRPGTFHKWMYALNNPIGLVDRTGSHPTPDTDCQLYPTYMDMRDLCEIAKLDDRNPTLTNDVLSAREAIYRAIVVQASLFGAITSPTSNGEGMLWAGQMLSHFLDGGGAEKSIRFNRYSTFVNDPGIARATREFRLPATDDEPTFIQPLLHRFIYEHVKEYSDGSTFSRIPLVRYDVRSRSVPNNIDPRPYATGWFGAFGHVPITGQFTGQAQRSCRSRGYILSYRADYRVEDTYEWFGVESGSPKSTPLPSLSGQEFLVPHEWAVSLTQANPKRAHSFDFTITWTEMERLWISEDFASFRRAAPWEW